MLPRNSLFWVSFPHMLSGIHSHILSPLEFFELYIFVFSGLSPSAVSCSGHQRETKIFWILLPLGLVESLAKCIDTNLNNYLLKIFTNIILLTSINYYTLYSWYVQC